MRYADHSDIPRLVLLAEQEHASSPWADEPFDATHCGLVMAQFISGYGRTLLCSDGGYIAGIVQPAAFTKRVVAMEYAWFARDGSGMGLLDDLQAWSRSMSARFLIVHDYIGDGRMAKVLERRRGYKRLGSALALSLEA